MKLQKIAIKAGEKWLIDKINFIICKLCYNYLSLRGLCQYAILMYIYFVYILIQARLSALQRWSV